ncbi:MAG TPA: hypothetical protein VK447_17470, partial [Myxococcaceae bacterium]|nr:hypothetical protein [Myxococcaceae bacterium]
MSLPLQLGARLLAVTLAAGPAAPVKPAPVAPPAQDGAMSPLLRAAKDLRCAYDEELARKALVPLRQADTSALGLPDEALGQAGPPRLYAATLDAVLDALGHTAARFPGMRRDVEAVVLSWRYCEVNHGNAPWDLVVEGGQRVRRPAASPFPAERNGFARWGFHAQDPADRYVPELITRSGLAPGQLALFLHELRMQRCFPDAWNGSTVFDAPVPFYAGPETARAEPLAASGRYPYAPSATCPPPPSPRVGVRAVHQGVLATGRSAKAVGAQTGTVAARSTGAGMVRNAARRVGAQGQKPGPAFTGAVSSVLGLLAPTGEVLKGTVFVSFPLADRPYLGVSAIYSPHSYFFVRGGLNYLFTAERNEEPFTWSWGFGYDDWHPGTFSVQVNRWEPVLVSRGLAL